MVSPITFLKQAYEELQVVIWPTRKEVIRLTIVVIGISLAVGIYIGGLDFVFTKLLQYIIR